MVRIGYTPFLYLFLFFWNRKKSNKWFVCFQCVLISQVSYQIHFTSTLLRQHFKHFLIQLILFQQLAVFAKDNCFRNLSRYSKRFGEFRRAAAQLYEFCLWLLAKNAILGYSGPWNNIPTWESYINWCYQPNDWQSFLKHMECFSEGFENNNPSWKRLLIDMSIVVSDPRLYLSISITHAEHQRLARDSILVTSKPNGGKHRFVFIKRCFGIRS